MEKSIGRFVLVGMVVFVALLAAAVYLGFNYIINSLPPEPREYVQNITVENNKAALFKEKIIRYPVKGVVIPLVLNTSISVGLSVDKDRLNFGVTPKGFNINKALNFKNTDYAPAKVLVVTYGSIKPFIKTEDNFILPDGGNKSLNIFMNASSIGEYSGEVDVIMRVPKYWVLEYMMG